MMVFPERHIEWIIWSTKSDNGYTVMGSRKLSSLDIETETDSIKSFDSYFSTHLYTGYDLKTHMNSFCMVQDNSEFAAFCALMEIFRQEKINEEKEIIARKEAVEARKRERERHANCCEACPDHFSVEHYDLPDDDWDPDLDE